MRAVLLLLGNDKETWQQIEQHMLRGSVRVFHRRMEKIDIRVLKPKVAERAQNIISRVSPEAMTSISEDVHHLPNGFRS